ncbi:AsmA family protein [Chitinophaga japonensis]|uniref:AsmA-like protein n=1 Tax=Chitinophaga japonensis TaxID=104662 RepID=A0A562T0J5_CHIJA|nr:AsmA family protein [Chitinophaga japonensis]TWI86530.1 AsmA-like protein [Chitinophaga japonensis]
MKRWLRITVLTGGSLLALVLLLWLLLALYIHLHRHAFREQLTERLSRHLHGHLTIREVKPSLLRSFPQVSMELDEVQLQDSLWQQHRHSLLDVQRIFVKVNTLSLLRRHLDIREITLQDGTIYLYTNKEGYTNTSVFARRDHPPHKPSSRKDADIARLQLRNILFVLDHRQKQKLFRIQVQSLSGSVNASDTALQVAVRTRLHIHDFAFNTGKGSYLHNKQLATSLQLNFNKRLQTLSIPAQRLEIDGQPLVMAATFSFAQKPAAFAIQIAAARMPFSSARAMLSPNISRKLDSIDLQQPLDLAAQLNGYIRYRDTPHVRISWATAGNTLVTRVGEWTNCSFKGDFNNELYPGQGHNDENSAVHLYGLRTEWNGLPLSADTIQVLNLKHPVLMGRFRSEFSLLKLNALAGGTFQFTAGKASANLLYKGSLLAGDTLPPYLEGAVQVQDGALAYLPRNLQLHDCNATVELSGQDLFFRNVRMQSAKSALQMEGSMRNILRLFYKAPEKVQLDWEIRSPEIDLDEFRFFLSPRRPGRAQHNKTAKTAAASRRARRLARQLEVVLNACNVNMQVQLDRLSYRRFSARQVQADLGLTQTDIRLRRISLSHAGGTLLLNGEVRPNGNNNRFRLDADISNVQIDRLFYAFENFGMQTLTSRNLKGLLSARADITGNLHDNGQLAPGSLFGTLRFELKQGALVHFAPLEDIGTFFFRKRNLSYITFDRLRNTLQLKGNRIIIPPMQISSSALDMDVNGVYGMPTGTDIYMDVPLRNPEKETRKKGRGIVLHLRATDDNKDGKVKIKLGKK